MPAHHLLWPVLSGVGRSDWAEILFSTVLFGAVWAGGMTARMTGGLPDPPLLGWRADLDLASLTRGLGSLDQALVGLQSR
jgi:hypothetical protein